MDDLVFHYQFEVKEGDCYHIEITIDAESLTRIPMETELPPDWVALEKDQCPHCPLSSDSHPHCPVAAALSELITHFDRWVSYDELKLTVITNQRRITQVTTAQRAISSLLGLLIATSGCPHTAYFKPMARFHLPLASEENTIYRASSMYLLAQFFLRRQNRTSDEGLGGLRKIYENLHVVNMHIAKRLKHASQSDSSLNAIVLLDSFTNTLPFVIEEHLDEIAYLFKPYQSDEYEKLLADLASGHEAS